jgi:hypothetical protein
VRGSARCGPLRRTVRRGCDRNRDPAADLGLRILVTGGRHAGGVDVQPITPWFQAASRSLTLAATRLGLVAPSFRSPPAVPGVDRTVRWQLDGGGAVVAVRLWGRPFAAIRADMVDGVLAANRVVRGSVDAARLRGLLEEVVPVPEEREAA